MSFEHSKEVKDAANVLRPHTHVPHVQAYALSAAGLLRTDADRMNAELAEAMVAYGTRCGSHQFVMNENWEERTRVWTAMRAILDARKPKVAPLDEVLTLWRECKCKVPGPLSDALDRLAAERAK